MNIKALYKRFNRKLDEMDEYEKTRFYTIAGISAFAFLIFIGLIVFFSLRHIGVVIGVDTTGLLGKPAVFVDNITSSPLEQIYVEMDGIYTAKVDMISPKQAVVVYFAMFKPVPPQNYRPKEVTIKSGMKAMTKSIPPLSR